MKGAERCWFSKYTSVRVGMEPPEECWEWRWSVAAVFPYVFTVSQAETLNDNILPDNLKFLSWWEKIACFSYDNAVSCVQSLLAVQFGQRN